MDSGTHPKMMYITVPKKARVSCKHDLAGYKEIVSLFNKHGFGIADFNNEGVSFYSKLDLKENSVPISSFYRMSKKEFVVFTEIIKRLDEAKHKLNSYANFVKQNL